MADITAEWIQQMVELRRRRNQMLAAYQQTKELTSRMIMEATMVWHPFDWIQTFAPEWYRAGLRHNYRRPDNFIADLIEYEASVPEGEAPSADGLVAFFQARWDAHPWKPILEGLRSLEEVCGIFQDDIWRPWLQKYYQEADVRGHIATLEGRSMLVWGSAGRVMMTIRGDEAEWPYLTFIAAESDEGYEELGHPRPRMGVQGVGGTLQQALDLVKPFLADPDRVRQLIHPKDSVTHPVVAAMRAQAQEEAVGG